METRVIIKTNDGRYVKAGTDCATDCATEFARSIFAAKMFKNQDAARQCVAGSKRFVNKYGGIIGGNYPTDFTIVLVEMREVGIIE